MRRGFALRAAGDIMGPPTRAVPRGPGAASSSRAHTMGEEGVIIKTGRAGAAAVAMQRRRWRRGEVARRIKTTSSTAVGQRKRKVEVVERACGIFS